MGAIAANTIVSWTDSDGGDHDGSLVTRAKGFDVIACAICGFRHVIPLPDTAELEHAYRDTHDTEESRRSWPMPARTRTGPVLPAATGSIVSSGSCRAIGGGSSMSDAAPGFS